MNQSGNSLQSSQSQEVFNVLKRPQTDLCYRFKSRSVYCLWFHPPGYQIDMYMKPELEVHKTTEWQEQISHNSMPDAFRSLPWSLQGRIVKESSNISKYSPESRDLWWSLWVFWQNWCSMVKWISCALLLRHNAINVLPRW